MPSISGDTARHVIIDSRDGHYLCFPDVCVTPSGRLVCAYGEYDQHVATRRGLAVKTSDDGGRSWSTPVILSRNRSHCPRLTVLDNGDIHLLDFNGILVHVSHDQGATWEPPVSTGLKHTHVVTDRPLVLPDGNMLTTGHSHRGSAALPNLRQAPSEQMVLRSTDGGMSYSPSSVLHFSKHLVLCEASLCALPDGRLAALMRENSHVFEPMHLSFSSDNGLTWSEPAPTPLVGHRPTMKVTASGRLLVTYRDVGPDSGTAAWLGTLQELTGPYLVHGRDKWALRPMTDARTATAALEGTVRVQDGEPPASIHLGSWWRVYPDRVEVETGDNADNNAEPTRCDIPAGQSNKLRLEYASGLVTLFVNDRKHLAMHTDKHTANTRIMAFSGTGWQRLTQHLEEPRLGRVHHWQWDKSQGPPQFGKEAAVLELDNGHGAHWSDFGYSGWCEIEPGSFFCAYYHADGSRDDYVPNVTAHVRGAWFTEDDFA